MFEILGIVFLVLIAIRILTLITMKVVNWFKEDACIAIRSIHELSKTEYGFYLIPTIHVNITNWLNITFYWLNFGYYFTIYITNEEEEDAINNAYYELRHNDKS